MATPASGARRPHRSEPSQGLGQGLGDILMTLQPRHALSDGVLRAAEASLRWGAGGAPVAGGADSVASAQLSNWLLETACREAELWNAHRDMPHAAPDAEWQFSPAVMVSVCLPMRGLREEHLVAQSRAALDRSGLSPWLLEVEVPEHVVAGGGRELLIGLSALRDLGVGVALDQFGSLSASPRLLQRLPLTAVKLDPSLVRDLVYDRDMRGAVRAAIALAHALDATVIAPAVETVAQRDILADMGCDDVQGPLFGGVMRPETFRATLDGPSG